MSATGRIVLLGATGYTGRLTALALFGMGRRPELAARSPEKLAALAEEIGTKHDGPIVTTVVDAGDAAAVGKLVGRGDVLLTTVGPFRRWGHGVAEAALAAGATYLDSTGEPGFIRAVFDRYGARAKDAGVAMLPAMGYDYVPGNLAAGLAVAGATEAVSRLEVGYFLDGVSPRGLSAGFSSGTAASLLLATGDPAHLFRDGRLVDEPAGRTRAVFPLDGGGRRSAFSVGSTEALSLPRVYPNLREVGAYLGWFGPATRVVQGLSYVLPGPGSQSKAAQAAGRGRAKLARRFEANTGQGPSAEEQAKVGSRVVAVAYDRVGRTVGRAELVGANPYAFTADFLAWAAARAAAGSVPATGVLGPLEAFSLADLLDGVRAAGLRRV
jgi:short subunit dehydrogenase-like uncharacterized protein